MRPTRLPFAALLATGCLPASVTWVCTNNEPLCAFDVVNEQTDGLGEATGVSLNRIAVYQAVEVDLMEDGVAVDNKTPVIEGRAAYLRVFVDVDDDFVGRDLTAVVEVYDGDEPAAAGQGDLLVDEDSTQGSLASTFNFNLEGAGVREGFNVHVKLLEADPDAKYPGSVGRVHWPLPEEEAPVYKVTNVGGPTRVVIQPIRYNADGSGRVPDTSDEAMERFREQVLAFYPTPDVEFEVREPMDYAAPVSPYSGYDFADLLFTVGVEVDRQPGQKVHALFNAVSTYAEFCGGACILGMSDAASSSVGVGFQHEESYLTMVHEVGHSHGMAHAPCGGAAGPDASYPYDQAFIGSWGYSTLTEQLYDPAVYHDVMSYCRPYWISDYNFRLLAGRIKNVNGARAQGEGLWREVWVMPDGEVRWGRAQPFEAVFEASEVRVELLDAAGEVIAVVDGLMTHFDHADGGVIRFPEPSQAIASVRVANELTRRPSVLDWKARR